MSMFSGLILKEHIFVPAINRVYRTDFCMKILFQHNQMPNVRNAFIVTSRPVGVTLASLKQIFVVLQYSIFYIL